MSNHEATLEQLVALAESFYSLPAVAMEVLQLTSNPTVDAPALKTCIENDPALTTKLLRVVNSSLFGLSREVSDLNQALALLGIKPLKLLVLGFSLPEQLFAGLAGDTLNYYWRHTLTKAVAAREISETLWHKQGDDAFIAGLLQDLGMLLLIQEVGDAYGKLIEKVRISGGDLLATEARSMGFDHTQLTARLLTHWGLPPALAEAVGWQSDHRDAPPSADAEPTLAQILHLAELFARLLADGQTETLSQLLSVGQTYKNLSQEQLETLVSGLEDKVWQLADVLSLELPEGLSYRDLLTQAHTQLSKVAASAAEDLLRGRADGEVEAELHDEMRSLSDAIGQVTASRAPRARAKTASPRTPAAAARPAVLVSPAPLAMPGHLSMAHPDSGLVELLTATVAACRRNRCALSLLLVELGDTKAFCRNWGEQGLLDARRLLEIACQRLDYRGAVGSPHGAYGWALILPDCDRQLAVQLGNQLIDGFSESSAREPWGRRGGLRVSVGAATVALPPRNFPPRDLFDAANHCVYASHAAGVSMVKSIEI